jgi:hypothetical protein
MLREIVKEKQASQKFHFSVDNPAQFCNDVFQNFNPSQARFVFQDIFWDTEDYKLMSNNLWLRTRTYHVSPGSRDLQRRRWNLKYVQPQKDNNLRISQLNDDSVFDALSKSFNTTQKVDEDLMFNIFPNPTISIHTERIYLIQEQQQYEIYLDECCYLSETDSGDVYYFVIGVHFESDAGESFFNAVQKEYGNIFGVTFETVPSKALARLYWILDEEEFTNRVAPLKSYQTQLEPKYSKIAFLPHKIDEEVDM